MAAAGFIGQAKGSRTQDTTRKLRDSRQPFRERHSVETTKHSDLEIQEAIKALLKVEKMVKSWTARREEPLEESATSCGQKDIWEVYERSKQDREADLNLLKQHLVSHESQQSSNLEESRCAPRPVYEAYLRVKDYEEHFISMLTAIKARSERLSHEYIEAYGPDLVELTDDLDMIREKMTEIQATYDARMVEFTEMSHEIRDGGLARKEREALLEDFETMVATYDDEMLMYDELRLAKEEELASIKNIFACIELDIRDTAAEEAE